VKEAKAEKDEGRGPRRVRKLSSKALRTLTDQAAQKKKAGRKQGVASDRASIWKRPLAGFRRQLTVRTLGQSRGVKRKTGEGEGNPTASTKAESSHGELT